MSKKIQNFIKRIFLRLKTNQDLLINFSSFPQHIIDYIEKCLLEDANSQPKYLLVFTCNDKSRNVAAPSQLDIIETNQFKHLTHLSLIFNAATETVLKQHQTALFKHLKSANKQLQDNLAFMQNDFKSQLATCESDLNCKKEELELIKNKFTTELSLKERNHQKELEKERELLANKYKDEINKLEQEMNSKEHDYRKKIQQLESRVSTLDTLNKQIQDMNYKHEETIRELRSKIISYEDEVQRVKENLQSYKNKNDHLQAELKDKHEQTRQQDKIICDLKQKLNYTEEAILELKKQLEVEMQLKKKIESEFEKMQFQSNLKEKEQRALEGEKEHFKSVIVTLQERIKELGEKEKYKSQLVAKYKNTSEEKDRNLFSVRQEISKLSNVLHEKNAEVKTLKEKISFTEEKLEVLNKQLKEKENIIRWLNKRLTDHDIAPLYDAPGHLADSPSTVTMKELIKINPSHKDFSPVLTGKNASSKSVRIEAGSPVIKEGSSIPPFSGKTTATDSAYCTISVHSNQDTPQILAGCHKMKFNPSNFECDQEALNAAFGDGRHDLKHSTAKKIIKPPKSVNSSTPKSSKKR